VAITVTQLTSFLAVVRGGSVTAAAEELVVTQPSVSAAVAALSRELGVDVTERAGRGVVPTPAGEAFAPYASDVLGLLDQGRRVALEAAGAAGRELRIAAVTTAAEYIVVPLIKAYTTGRSDVSVTLSVDNREGVFASVLEHRADVAIAGRPPGDGGLVGTPFLRNEIVAITTPDDPLVGEPDVPVQALAERPWLLRERGSGTRTMVEDYLAEHGLTPIALTLGSNGAIKHAAQAGLGISLQSRLAVQFELAQGRLATIALREPPAAREWYVIQTAVGPVRDATETFTSFVTSRSAREALSVVVPAT
jgi:LysR family transcriptional regulator, low CO2-responsive transcriptional regulator